MSNFQFEHLWSILTGGAGGAIAAWLAQTVLADRIRDKVGHEYAKQLELYKQDLTRQLELARADLEEHGRLHREQWQIKRDACLAALRIVDSVLTNLPWEDSSQPGQILSVKTLPIDTEEARDTMNRLILSCDNKDVVLKFLKAVGITESGETAESIDVGWVQELRNAIRTELGFGTEFTFPSRVAWLISVHGDQANRGKSTDKRDPT